MTLNRLRLDFSLTTREERNNFLQSYLTQQQFIDAPPTEDELNTMADYLLWGKDEKGKNGKQQGLDLKSKHGTWDESPLDSLDQLLEQPTFSEAGISALGSTQFRTKKETFSREDALANASPSLRDQFIFLFSRIDQLELQIQHYEILHGKRTKEIRSALLNKFSQEELNTLYEKVTHWNQYKYLRHRHELVELRREQYTLRDSYRKIMFSAPTEQFQEPDETDFDAGIAVLPLGAKHESPLCASIFRAWPDLIPHNFSQEELKLVSNLYWSKKSYSPTATELWFDFRQEEHVYQLLDQLIELEGFVPEQSVSSNLAALLHTLYYYIEQADLTDIQREILQMKLNKRKNVDIAWDINHKYAKTYTSNYISTIFCQRIIPRICDAAKYHELVISNIFFEEEFKTCTCCGETMLRCPDNFTKRARANDGFSARCKRCEKKARQGV